MKIVFSDHALNDYHFWKKTNKNTLNRINKLIEDIKRNPFEGIGKPEPLRYELQGCWSRRIDSTHRLVYEVTKKELRIIACRYHY